MSDGSELDPKRVDALKAVYEQVCDAHNGIADFRAKLLALWPIASGTGILLLLDKGLQPKAVPHLLGFGILGAGIALGLFIFELVGIHRCRTLRVYGSELEKKLLPTTDNFRGRFTEPKEKFYRFVRVDVASLTIYPTVIAAWSYVACIGVEKVCSCGLGPLKVSALVLLVVVIIGSFIRLRQERLLDELLQKCTKGNP